MFCSFAFMKTLKFRPYLVKLILDGVKDNTFRLFDDKDLSEGDELSLVNWVIKEEFAKAVVVSVLEKSFGELTKEDLEGHETFSSEKEMYEKYSEYYQRPVDKNTKLKIIRFRLK